MPEKPTYEELEQRIRQLEKTESKYIQAQEALEESHQRYRLLVQDSIDAVVVVKGTEIKFVNQAALDMFGCQKESDMVGSPMIEFISPAYHDLMVERGAARDMGQYVVNRYEFEALRKDQSTFSAEVSVSSITFKGESARQGVIRDINGYRQAEEALRESERLLRAIIDNSAAIIYLKDFEGRFTLVNQEFKRYFNITEEEILGKTDYNFMPKALADRYKENDQAIMKGEKPLKFEETAIVNNEERTAISVKVPLWDRKGEVIGICGISTDITERKKVENEIFKQKQKAERYLNLAKVMFIGLGLDGKINLANQHACKVLECDEADMIGYDWFDKFIPERIRSEIRKVFDQLVSGRIEQAEYFENSVVTKSGKEKIIAWHNTYISDEDGKIASLLSAGEDITDKRKLEAQLQQAQKMESIGNLAGGIAHDFNNILFPIVGLSEMLLDDLTPGSLVYENAQEILKAGKRGSDLVKQILAFSRRSEKQKIPVRVQQILVEVLNLSRSSIPADIKIIQDVQRDCGPVMADPGQIHQIAMNLITNAYHAVEETGGEITVKLRETYIGDDDLTHALCLPGHYAWLSVSDTGCGIAPDVMNKIFEPYFTTKKQGKGTGLGLAVVHGIVKAHRGDIGVYSDVGKGTTFNVYLPLKEKRGFDTAPIKNVEIPRAIDERILLVDDDESIARLEKQMLERLGYRVDLCTSSLDALDRFRSDPDGFDLVITDMTMPNLTGDQLARELLSIKSDIPVIVCTGFSERINKEKAAALGIKGFLIKPMAKSELAKMVRDSLDGAKDSA